MSKRTNITISFKKKLWYKYFGEERGNVQCPCCKIADISFATFEPGYIKSIKNGGTTTIDNRKPICKLCYANIGTVDIDAFSAQSHLKLNALISNETNIRFFEIPFDHNETKQLLELSVHENKLLQQQNSDLQITHSKEIEQKDNEIKFLRDEIHITVEFRKFFQNFGTTI